MAKEEDKGRSECDRWKQVVRPRDVGGNSGGAVGVVGLRGMLLCASKFC
jgi:hypothetical protein